MCRRTWTPGWFLPALGLPALLASSGGAQSTLSLRFCSHGSCGIDRVEIPTVAPARPGDVGAGNFTLDFWMMVPVAENGAGACVVGADGGINGNTIFDHDTYGAGDCGEFGISLFLRAVEAVLHEAGSGAPSDARLGGVSFVHILGLL